jgi:hypothetical protein
MPRSLAFALAAGLAFALAHVTAGWAVTHLPDVVSGLGLVGWLAAFTTLANGCLWLASRAPLSREQGAPLGLAALVAGVGLWLESDGLPFLEPVHCAALIVAAVGLGETFAGTVKPRLQDPSVLVTAAVALAVFDVWSVWFGPAHHAVSGGLLQSLLLTAPTLDGNAPFLGISDLVVAVLLASLAAQLGWGGRRAQGAALAGMLLALGQAAATRHATPALPWMGLCFCAAYWPQVKPGPAGWARTARWSVGAAVLLGLITVVLRATHRS